MNYKKKQRLRRKRGWVYLRFCFPILLLLLVLISLRIPCLQYTTKDTGANDPISTWELAVNSFDQSRAVVFGSAEQTQSNVLFSRTVLIVLSLSVLLFLVGCAVAIWSVIDAFTDSQASAPSKAHLVFVTLVPNRIALILWLLTLLPLCALPRLTVLIYDVMMNYAVTLAVTFAEPVIIAAVLLAVEAALLAALAPTEQELGLDPFHRIASVEEDAVETVMEEPEEATAPTLNDRAREEQLAQIRRMLNRDDRE